MLTRTTFKTGKPRLPKFSEVFRNSASFVKSLNACVTRKLENCQLIILIEKLAWRAKIGFLILADGKGAGLDYSETVEKNVLLVFHDHHVFCVVRNGSNFFLLDPAKEIVENIFSLSFF